MVYGPYSCSWSSAQNCSGILIPINNLLSWSKLQTFTILQENWFRTKKELSSKELGLKNYYVWLWNASKPRKSNQSMSMICAINSRVHFNSNSRFSMHSDKMDIASPTLQQHWSTMLSKKVKEDNRKKIMEGVGVTNIIQELVELRRKVRVLIPASLTLVVQYSMQHHRSTSSRLTHPSHSMAKAWMVQHWNPGYTK